MGEQGEATHIKAKRKTVEICGHSCVCRSEDEEATGGHGESARVRGRGGGRDSFLKGVCLRFCL